MLHLRQESRRLSVAGKLNGANAIYDVPSCHSQRGGQVRNAHGTDSHLLGFPMRLINRTAVTVVGAQPFIDWTMQRDAAFAADAITVVRTRPLGIAYLLPEFDQEEDLHEWVEENYGWLFEFQLSTWTEDE